MADLQLVMCEELKIVGIRFTHTSCRSEVSTTARCISSLVSFSQASEWLEVLTKPDLEETSDCSFFTCLYRNKTK